MYLVDPLVLVVMLGGMYEVCGTLVCIMDELWEGCRLSLGYHEQVDLIRRDTGV